ncbi:hypothetical protein B0H13DRAFT_2276849 [Mycena leptocephala]|nr:hypothetical protein B0H13DRAFT_2276849 [Mycena leptocephala]
MSQGGHVYGNETDFLETTGRARGVRWSGDESKGRAVLPERGDNDTDFPRTTRHARGLKVWYGEWCGRARRSQKRSPKWMWHTSLITGRIAPDGAGAGGCVWRCPSVHPRNPRVGMRCTARESLREGGMSDAESGGMPLRSRRVRAVDDVSDAGGCVVREDGARMRMYGACVHVGCMGAAWKTENQPRREDARRPHEWFVWVVVRSLVGASCVDRGGSTQAGLGRWLGRTRCRSACRREVGGCAMCARDGMDGCPGVRAYIRVDVFALVPCGCGGVWRRMRCGCLFWRVEVDAVWCWRIVRSLGPGLDGDV